MQMPSDGGVRGGGQGTAGLHGWLTDTGEGSPWLRAIGVRLEAGPERYPWASLIGRKLARQGVATRPALPRIVLLLKKLSREICKIFRVH